MLNDKDDQFDGQEESEYHFSDEEVSYEVEPETSKPPAAENNGPKDGILNKLYQSKRMLISGAVFLLLIFVVYKMVSPTSQMPQTDITAQQIPKPAAMPTAIPKQMASGNQQLPPAQQEALLSKQTTQVPPGSPPQVAAPAGMTAASPALPPPANLPPPGTPVTPSVGMQQASATGQPFVSSSVQAVSPTAMSSALPQAGAQQQAGVVTSTLVEGQQQAAVQPVAGPSQEQIHAGMPLVIPVQSPIPTTVAETTSIPLVSVSTQPGSMPFSQGAEAKIANLQANSERLMTQLQADYTQKLSEYAAQNKALQEQMQVLSSRMAGMESQLSQLLQALTHQMPGPSGNPESAQPQPVPDQKLSYNVQAIIPGRAWLKSESGETLTVAEGDVIRDIGRITKIDPYDGVVEINTGNKVVSLSYGNGG